MAKDKKLDTVTGKIPLIDSDYVQLTAHRTETFVNPQDKEKPIVKQGTLDVKYHVQGSVGKLGQLKHVRAALSEEASKALKK